MEKNRDEEPLAWATSEAAPQGNEEELDEPDGESRGKRKRNEENDADENDQGNERIDEKEDTETIQPHLRRIAEMIQGAALMGRVEAAAISMNRLSREYSRNRDLPEPTMSMNEIYGTAGKLAEWEARIKIWMTNGDEQDEANENEGHQAGNNDETKKRTISEAEAYTEDGEDDDEEESRDSSSRTNCEEREQAAYAKYGMPRVAVRLAATGERVAVSPCNADNNWTLTSTMQADEIVGMHIWYLKYDSKNGCLGPRVNQKGDVITSRTPIESIASARETVKNPLRLKIKNNGTCRLSELAIDGAIRVHLTPGGTE